MFDGRHISTSSELGPPEYSWYGELGDVLYVLDRDLRLIWKNEAWDRFALENEGAALVDLTAHPVLEGFTGHARIRWQTLYALLLTSDHDSYGEIFICPSPSERRSFRLRIHVLRDAQGAVDRLVHVSHQIPTPLPGKLQRTPEWSQGANLGHGIGLFAWNRALYGPYGGDLVWFNQQEDRIVWVIADVAGHGPEAARLASWLREQLPALVAESPSRAVTTMNARLVDHLAESSQETPPFITGLWGVINLDTQVLTLCNFGHPHLITERQGILALDSGLPIGIESHLVEYPEHHYPLAELGSRILAYTDGVTEQFGPEGRMFGSDHLAELFGDLLDVPLSSAVHEIDLYLERFRGTALVKDDQSILAISFPDRG